MFEKHDEGRAFEASALPVFCLGITPWEKAGPPLWADLDWENEGMVFPVIPRRLL